MRTSFVTRPASELPRAERRAERGGRHPKRRRAAGSTSAFTLLEAVIALGILAFGLLGVAAAVLSSVSAGRRSHSLTQALYLAEQRIESFQAMPAADVLALLTAPGYPNDPANPIDPDPGDGALMQFNRRWLIQQDVPELGVMTIDVQVDWVDEQGITRTVSLQTVKANL